MTPVVASWGISLNYLIQYFVLRNDRSSMPAKKHANQQHRCVVESAHRLQSAAPLPSATHHVELHTSSPLCFLRTKTLRLARANRGHGHYRLHLSRAVLPLSFSLLGWRCGWRRRRCRLKGIPPSSTTSPARPCACASVCFWYDLQTAQISRMPSGVRPSVASPRRGPRARGLRPERLVRARARAVRRLPIIPKAH